MIYESVSDTLSASDSESAIGDSLLDSMSEAQSHLTSESTAPGDAGRPSRIASLLSSLNIFGNRK